MGIIVPTMPTAGDPRGGEEIDLANAVQAILNEFNGNVDSANLKNGSVAKIDLATDVLNNFLKLGTAADLRVAFGAVGPPENFGGVPTHVSTITHGLKDAAGANKTPSVVLAVCSPGNTSASATDAIVCMVVPGSFTATTFQVRLSSPAGGAMAFPGIVVYFLAVG